MILLLGGTSESGAIASALAQAGEAVLVSTATDEPLDIGTHANIRRRCGRLDETAMLELVHQEGVRAIVDAAHPYAAAAHATALAVAKQAGIDCVRFVRPRSIDPSLPGVHVVADHAQAARLAFSFGRPVLLTTGANNLVPYVHESIRTKVALVARVLPRSDSLDACTRAGLDSEHIIAAKGPFSLGQNVQHIREHGIGTLVTKDGGDQGGTGAKLEAARQEHCQVVVVARPQDPSPNTVSDVYAILQRLKLG